MQAKIEVWTKAGRIDNSFPTLTFSKWNYYVNFFNKEYWKGKIKGYNIKKLYWTVRYNENDKEEHTHQEINAYLIPPSKWEYWTEEQSGPRRSKQIEENKIYSRVCRCHPSAWYNVVQPPGTKWTNIQTLSQHCIRRRDKKTTRIQTHDPTSKIQRQLAKIRQKRILPIVSRKQKEDRWNPTNKRNEYTILDEKITITKEQNSNVCMSCSRQATRKRRSQSDANNSRRRPIRIPRRHKHRNCRTRNSKDGIQQRCEHTRSKIYDNWHQ